jgi:hypothetical protein
MKLRWKPSLILFGFGLALVGTFLAWSPSFSGEKKPAEKKSDEKKSDDKKPAGKKPAASKQAIENARQLIQMADNMHKAYVIHVTGTYVKAQESVPAAQIAKKVYQHMEENKFFSGRLIDATGKPINTDNVAKTDFEKKAVKAIQGGAKYFEELGEKGGSPVLRAGTIVPAVMKQCINCHPGFKEGDLIGVLTYEVPINR